MSSGCSRGEWRRIFQRARSESKSLSGGPTVHVEATSCTSRNMILGEVLLWEVKWYGSDGVGWAGIYCYYFQAPRDLEAPRGQAGVSSPFGESGSVEGLLGSVSQGVRSCKALGTGHRLRTRWWAQAPEHRLTPRSVSGSTAHVPCACRVASRRLASQVLQSISSGHQACIQDLVVSIPQRSHTVEQIQDKLASHMLSICQGTEST